MTDGHPRPGHRAVGSCQQFPSSTRTEDTHTPATARVMVIRRHQDRRRPQARDPLTRRCSSSSLAGQGRPESWPGARAYPPGSPPNCAPSSDLARNRAFRGGVSLLSIPNKAPWVLRGSWSEMHKGCLHGSSGEQGPGSVSSHHTAGGPSSTTGEWPVSGAPEFLPLTDRHIQPPGLFGCESWGDPEGAAWRIWGKEVSATPAHR